MLDSNDGSPVLADLPLTDPRCKNETCLAFYAAENASQAAVSTAHQVSYGLWTTVYYTGLVAIFMAAYALHLYRDQKLRATPTSERPSIVSKAVAAGRWMTYRRFSGHLARYWALPSFGILAITLMSGLLALVAAFAIRPYYREHRAYGLPPLSTRTGIMAQALTPIVFALSGKFNLVTYITGIGREKLNVWHRYSSYLLSALVMAHMIPFIVAPLKDGGPSALAKQWTPHSYEVGSLIPCDPTDHETVHWQPPFWRFVLPRRLFHPVGALQSL